MKNYLMVALILCAIPAVAFGQKVSCDDCTHVASVYMGEGGVIATADDADMVTWVASCGGVTRSGELEPNDDGVVAALWTGDLACHGDAKSEFQIGPIMDGGWFWITDADNSAVGGLVAMDVLDNDAADITSAGEGVTMTDGKGAVFLKETSTGRVGILPNILPEPPVAALRKCGASGAGTAASPFARVVSECALGDGGTMVLANYTNAVTGGTTRVMDGGSVTRPGGSANTVVLIDLWGNGTGHFVNATDAVAAAPPVPAGVNFLLGQPSVAGTGLRAQTRYTGVTFRGTVGTGPGGAALPTSGTTADADAGIVMDGTTVTNLAQVSIGAKSGYCSKTNNHTAVVRVYADVDDTGAALVTPPIKRAGARANPTNPTNAGSISFNVVCPAASANQGQELVPENPFPISE